MRIEGPRSLPTGRTSQQLLLEVERTVAHFPRYHKYTLDNMFQRVQ